MNFNITSLIFLFGAVQALLLITGINLNKPLYSDLKKVTTFLLMNTTIVMVYYVLMLNKICIEKSFVHSLGTAAWMGITPFYYLLTLSIQAPGWELNWKHLRYFIIPLLFLVEMIASFFGYPMWLFKFLGNDIQLYLDVWMSLFFGTSFYFIIQSMILNKKQRQEEVNKNRELRWFSYLFFAVLLIYGTAYLIIRLAYVDSFELTMLALLEFFIFMLIYKVFKITPFKNFFEVSKYDNNTLSKKQLENYAQQLEMVMENEKPYLNKKLKLNDLAKLSGINSNNLSQLFNLFYRSNFYDFINQYRLGYLEKIIVNPSYRQYKIMALAEESGFNSKATFYKVFKEKHQLTPSQFVKRHTSLSLGVDNK
ncbi:MAG: helix-turn-helix domain-containing protein [Saprospiraceae bacterium]